MVRRSGRLLQRRGRVLVGWPAFIGLAFRLVNRQLLAFYYADFPGFVPESRLYG